MELMVGVVVGFLLGYGVRSPCRDIAERVNGEKEDHEFRHRRRF